MAASGESDGVFVLHVAGVALHPVPDNLVVAAALTLFSSGEEPPTIPIAGRDGERGGTRAGAAGLRSDHHGGQRGRALIRRNEASLLGRGVRRTFVRS